MGLFYSYSESLLTDFQVSINNSLKMSHSGQMVCLILSLLSCNSFSLSYIIFKINYNLFNSKIILLLLSFYFYSKSFYITYEQYSVSRYRATPYPLSENAIIFRMDFYFFFRVHIWVINTLNVF